MIIRTVLLVAAVLIFLLIGFEAITTDITKWQEVGFAAGFAALIPLARLTRRSPTMKTEPVITVAIVTAIITAIVGFTAAFGVWSPSKVQVTSIITLVGVVVPFIGSIVARSKVTPVAPDA